MAKKKGGGGGEIFNGTDVRILRVEKLTRRLEGAGRFSGFVVNLIKRAII